MNYPAEVRKDDKGQFRMLVGNRRWRLAEQSECWYCGNIFWRVINKTHPVKFCSAECWQKAREKTYAQRRKGKRCPICYDYFKVQQATAYRHVTCGKPSCTFELKRRIALKRHAEPGQRLFHKVK